MDRPRPHKPSFYFIAEESADMRKSIRCFAVVTIVFLVTMIFAGPVLAQDVKFDSDTISGLGARNIGSAAMSGRVAAIAAVKEDGRLTVRSEERRVGKECRYRWGTYQEKIKIGKT